MAASDTPPPEFDVERAGDIAARAETLIEAYDQTPPEERSVSLLLDDLRDVLGIRHVTERNR